MISRVVPCIRLLPSTFARAYIRDGPGVPSWVLGPGASASGNPATHEKPSGRGFGEGRSRPNKAVNKWKMLERDGSVEGREKFKGHTSHEKAKDENL